MLFGVSPRIRIGVVVVVVVSEDSWRKSKRTWWIWWRMRSRIPSAVVEASMMRGRILQ